MKTIYLTLFFCVLFAGASQAKIWRVNNNPGTSANFTTLQAAHDAATAGDTIMVEPSATSYAGATCIIRLVILGPGYRLNENFPNAPNIMTATVSGITFSAGSSGSIIAGVTLSSTTYIYTSNITVTRTYGASIQLYTAGVSNISITRNYNLYVYSTSNPMSNVIISNNHLNGIYLYQEGPCLLTNNIFEGTINLTGQTLSNNILVGTSAATLTSCTLSYNIDARTSGGTAFGTTNGNKGVAANSVFVGPTGNTIDSQWKLKAGSTATAAGIGGIDCGIYGGAGPYVLSGLPPVPMITKLITTGVGNNSVPLQVTISAQSNN